MQTLIFHLGRALLQLHLLAVFFYFFGLPAIERFLSREVTIMILSKFFWSNNDNNRPKVMGVKMKRDTNEGIEAPAQMWKKQIKMK